MSLRLLIDEDLSPSVAHALAAEGHDAICVRDRGRLGTQDWNLFSWCVAEQRTICTANGADFVRLAEHRQAQGEDHYGVLVVDQDTWGVEGVIQALRRFLGAAPHSLLNKVVFVEPPV